MIKTILVLESPWDDRSVRSMSVWPFVSEFATAMELEAFYQPFSDKESFCHWVQRFHKDRTVKGPKLLYVAAHGSEGRIGGLRKMINAKTVVDACKKAKTVKFVHFGSCLFGTEKNLSALLKAAPHVQWAAGYEQIVDWVDSTLFDLLLWRRLAERDGAVKGLHFPTIAEKRLAEFPGLARTLGFRFQYRYHGSCWTL